MPVDRVAERFAQLFRDCMDSGLGQLSGEKWTAEALEKKSGTSKRTLYTWLSGELNEPPKDSTFKSVEEVFRQKPTKNDLVAALVATRNEWKTAAWAASNSSVFVAERKGTIVEYAEWERLSQSMFRLLERGSGDRKVVDRFLDHDENGEILRDPSIESRFQTILDANRFVVLTGRAGSGKTMTALDLAKSRKSEKNRIFVATDWRTAGEDSFIQGALARAHQPSIIFMDDVHHDYPKAERLLDRTLHSARGKPLRLVLAARVDNKDQLGDLSDAAELLAKADADGALIRLEPSDDFFRAVLKLVRPDIRLASAFQFDRLLTISARDLTLFRQTLDSLDSLNDLDQLSIHDVSKRFLRRYFAAAHVHAPNLLRLAALGQFEISPPVDWFGRPLEPAYPDAASALVFEKGRPLAYQFVHGSTAELAFSALCWAHAVDDPIQFASHEIVAFLQKFPSEQKRSDMIGELLARRLRLMDDILLKSSILDEPIIIEWFTDMGTDNLYVILKAVIIKQKTRNASVYLEIISKHIRSILFPDDEAGADSTLLARVLNVLNVVESRENDEILRTLGSNTIFELFVTGNGSLPELFKTIRRSPEALAASLIGALTDDLAAKLIDRTVNKVHRSGTIHLTWRDLAKRNMPDGGTQLEALEARIGADAMLRLVDKAEGTLPELVRILQYSSENFAASLIGALTDDLAAKLIHRTVQQGTSIGTIHLTWRDLAKRNMPDGGTQLEALEARIGADAMLRLVDKAEGTLPELVRILQYSSKNFAASLIGALTENLTAKLIDRTVQQGTSIGAIGLSLRDLAKRNMPGGGTQLEALEARIGADAMLGLVDRADGTLPELLLILQYSSKNFAASLIGALTENLTAKLIDRTVQQGTSIGAIGLSLRDLAKRNMPGGGTQLEALHKHVDTADWWRLIAGCGDCLHLSYLLSTFALNKRNEILSHSSSIDTWLPIVSRSSLFGVARLVIDIWECSPAHIMEIIENTIRVTLDELISRSTWFEIRTALTLAESKNHIGILNDLRSAVLTRLDSIELPHYCLDDPVEAICFLSTLWVYRPDQRDDLSNRIFDILPPEITWKKNSTLLSSFHLLLQICCDSKVGYPTAQRAIIAAVDLARSVDLEKCNSLSLFLFLWNLYALKMEKSYEAGFVDNETLPVPVCRNLVEVAANRIERRGILRDRSNHLALVGITAFLVPSFEVEIRSLLAGNVPDTVALLEEAKNQTFVPAYFVMKGLDLAKDGSTRIVFSDSMRRLLVTKTKSYSWRGKAINNLLRDLEAS